MCLERVIDKWMDGLTKPLMRQRIFKMVIIEQLCSRQIEARIIIASLQGSSYIPLQNHWRQSRKLTIRI